jgi:hypothetical protein
MRETVYNIALRGFDARQHSWRIEWGIDNVEKHL